MSSSSTLVAMAPVTFFVNMAPHSVLLGGIDQNLRFNDAPPCARCKAAVPSGVPVAKGQRVNIGPVAVMTAGATPVAPALYLSMSSSTTIGGNFVPLASLSSIITNMSQSVGAVVINNNYLGSGNGAWEMYYRVQDAATGEIGVAFARVFDPTAQGVPGGGVIAAAGRYLNPALGLVWDTARGCADTPAGMIAVPSSTSGPACIPVTQLAADIVNQAANVLPFPYAPAGFTLASGSFASGNTAGNAAGSAAESSAMAAAATVSLLNACAGCVVTVSPQSAFAGAFVPGSAPECSACTYSIFGETVAPNASISVSAVPGVYVARPGTAPPTPSASVTPPLYSDALDATLVTPNLFLTTITSSSTHAGAPPSMYLVSWSTVFDALVTHGKSYAAFPLLGDAGSLTASASTSTSTSNMMSVFYRALTAPEARPVIVFGGVFGVGASSAASGRGAVLGHVAAAPGLYTRVVDGQVLAWAHRMGSTSGSGSGSGNDNTPATSLGSLPPPPGFKLNSKASKELALAEVSSPFGAGRRCGAGRGCGGARSHALMVPRGPRSAALMSEQAMLDAFMIEAVMNGGVSAPKACANMNALIATSVLTAVFGAALIAIVIMALQKKAALKSG
jgi:hypothetical protein